MLYDIVSIFYILCCLYKRVINVISIANINSMLLSIYIYIF